VRVKCAVEIVEPDFVPRCLTGFQVKKPDMSAAATLLRCGLIIFCRDVIRELADASGAYVIISAQGSVADKPLAARRQAIREALRDLPTAAQLYTDFYDRDRIANWVINIRGLRLGHVPSWTSTFRMEQHRQLGRWRHIHSQAYLSDEKTCLIDERSRDSKHLTVTKALLDCAMRSLSLTVFRLIGLSGVGKIGWFKRC